ncbi:MAG: PDZ domain-containing protein [Fimbriimonadales bacterium]
MSLLLAAAAAITLGQESQEMRLMRYPAIHGDTVVFTYAGDLWEARKGDPARRLTSHPNVEFRAKISPDGKWIAFTGSYDGNPDVYLMPIEGGEPKRLTFEPGANNVIGWTPDGKIMYASTYGNFTNRQQRLWLISPNGGLPLRTPITEIFDGTMAADGHTLYYQRANSNAFNWRHYRGGTQGRVSVYDLATNTYREFPAQREQYYEPMVVGSSVYYLSDKNLGTLNLYRSDLNGGNEKELTSYSDADIKWPNTDGKSIIFERDGYLYTYDIGSGKVDKLFYRIKSDNISARPYLRQLGSSISEISISPSGTRVVAEARGRVFSIPAKQGDTHTLTVDTTARERFPEWSPDGKTIAFVTDAGDPMGGFHVYTRPQLGGAATQLTADGYPIEFLSWSPDGKKIAFGTRSAELWYVDVGTKKAVKVFAPRFGRSLNFSWSPDSKWMAYIDEAPNRFGVASLYELATAKSTPVTTDMYQTEDVAFDLNGKYLYFTSNRTFSPNYGLYEFSLKVEDAARIYAIPLTKDLSDPLTVGSDEEGSPSGKPSAGSEMPAVKIDFDGIVSRTIVLPMAAGSYPFIEGASNGVFYYGNGVLSKFDLSTRQSTAIMAGPQGLISFNPNRTKFAYDSGGVIGIVDVHPGIAMGEGKVDTGNVSAVIDPREEWNQMFWEAWRFERDNYYDPNMVGLDWKAIGKRYAGYLPYLAHRTDLNYIFGLMLSELGTGHAYVGGGDLGPMPPPISIGQLGADYESANGHIRLAKIYRGDNSSDSDRAPLGDPGVAVNEGEYLLEIDGKSLDGNTNPDSLLLDKANKYVTLTVNSTPTTTGARQVRVKTVASEGNLRFDAWIEGNRQYIDKVSGGRIGYMYIPDTNYPGSIALIKGFYSQIDKDAVVVDERWNGGGFIQPWFVDTLARRVRAGIVNRHGAPSTDAVAIEGPKTLLINQYAGSGGDFFPWMFRQAKLGPLIGKRTWGGLVGISSGAPLLDGGSVTAPEFGIYDRESGHWIAENKGIDPDIDIDLRPDLVTQGKDPQLDAAIQYLMKEVQKGGPKYKVPPFPKVAGGGS